MKIMEYFRENAGNVEKRQEANCWLVSITEGTFIFWGASRKGRIQLTAPVFCLGSRGRFNDRGKR